MPRYGYDLRQVHAARGLPIEEDTLYPLLRRLESQGVLSSEWRNEGGPPLRYYVLSATPTGRPLRSTLTATWKQLNDTMISSWPR